MGRHALSKASTSLSASAELNGGEPLGTISPQSCGYDEEIGCDSAELRWLFGRDRSKVR